MFYWASKPAISVENGVCFSSKMREKGVFFKLQYEHGIRFGREWEAAGVGASYVIVWTTKSWRHIWAIIGNFGAPTMQCCQMRACVPNEEVLRVMTYDCLLMSTKWLCHTAAVLWRWQIYETGRACAYCKNMTLASICCLLQIKIFSMEIVFDKFENWVIMRNYYLQCVWKNGPWQLKIVSLRCGSEGAMVFEASDIAGQIRYFSHPCVG